MELEMDIDELLKEHSQELTTEEILALHCVSQEEVEEENLSEEKEEELFTKSRHFVMISDKKLEYPGFCFIQKFGENLSQP
ncbi:hypothetical protein AVEN_38956-1 [Araneus ventricosus]|uniref:Uncharacterized protein n=1 Tax=Araneus ventricosus TaxID=182803 RepID=A0A4Y2Q1J1_ARAVE|nr:hypothetical protein AVEN_38956-1 [Araneus ventricosus]